MHANESAKIEKIRKYHGDNLTIMGHHYQSDQIIAHTDIQGDSLELARKIVDLDSRYIIFCGVHFMAETAAVLAKPNQHVFLPDHFASCVMAETAPANTVNAILTDLNKYRKIIPLAYVNSSLAVKTLCGLFGGSVCTSANARKMMDWGLKQADGVLFLPDKHLGTNTANDLGIPKQERTILDIRSMGQHIDYSSASRKKLLLWPGVCAVHHRIKPRHLQDIREKDPQALIIVHPECSPEVVSMSDAKGSTSQIINYIKNAPPESAIYVGTEENMVNRLAGQFFPDFMVRSILPTYCSNMAKITPPKLLKTLADLKPENQLHIPQSGRDEARKALQTMLKVCS
ncbi:MAG: quinolinate synthase NadA [Thermodesulfobacteriota bacterium]